MHLVATIVISLALLGGSAAALADSSLGLGEVVAEFELQNRDGAVVHFDEFLGRNVLVSFGFTNCVHICPMIAANMARAIAVTDKDVVGVFISVDTERDSPATTDHYARKFGKNMIGLSGNYYQVAAAAKNFNVTFAVTKSEDNYTVQHTPSIFLISPAGRLIDVFAMNSPAENIAAAMH